MANFLLPGQNVKKKKPQLFLSRDPMALALLKLFPPCDIYNKNFPFHNIQSRDRLVVRTLRCGRSNPGSNPGPGIVYFCLLFVTSTIHEKKLVFNQN